MPCLVKADGTIIAPIAETWKIRNDSPQPVTLDTAVADTITPGTSITAKSQPTTLYEDDTQDGKGNYTISINDTRNETRAEGGTDEHPVQIVLGGGNRSDSTGTCNCRHIYSTALYRNRLPSPTYR